MKPIGSRDRSHRATDPLGVVARIAAAFVFAVLLLAAPPALAGADGAPAQIQVTRFKAVGNTVLSEADLERILGPQEGKMHSLATIRQVARTLKNAYRAKGYMANVFVPAQEMADGIVRLQVFEGKYGKVTVEGNKHYTEEFIHRFFTPALATGFVDQQSLQRSLLVLNQFNDLNVQAILDGKSGKRVDVTLKVRDSNPLHVILDYDNFGISTVGRNRAGLAVQVGNLVTGGDTLFVKGTTPFPAVSSKPYIQAAYGAPVGDKGSRLEFQFATAQTTLGEAFRVLDLRGESEIYVLRGVVPHVIKTKELTFWGLEFASKSVRNSIFSNVPVSTDEVRVIAGSHKGTRFHRKGQTGHSVTATVGLGSALGGSTTSDRVIHSRVGASNEFVKVNGDLVRVVKLDSTNSLILRGQGQLAGDGLLVPEQFAIGGPDTVRGYQQGEFLGDTAYVLSGELRNTVWSRGSDQLQLLGFYDHGHATLQSPLRGEIKSQSLSSAGVGFRASLFNGFVARADVGIPLSPSQNIDGEKARLHAQIQKRF